MFSILRSISVFTSDNKTLHAMWKDANPGIANAFVTRDEMAEMNKAGWREGARVFKAENLCTDADMTQAAWDVLDTFNTERIANVQNVFVEDEYIALKKNGRLDHASLFKDYMLFDGRGNADGKRTRFVERTRERFAVSG